MIILSYNGIEFIKTKETVKMLKELTIISLVLVSVHAVSFILLSKGIRDRPRAVKVWDGSQANK